MEGAGRFEEFRCALHGLHLSHVSNSLYSVELYITLGMNRMVSIPLCPVWSIPWSCIE